MSALLSVSLFIDVFLRGVFVFPREEVHLSARYSLIVLVDPDCAGGCLGRALAVPWLGVLYSFVLDILPFFTVSWRHKCSMLKAKQGPWEALFSRGRDGRGRRLRVFLRHPGRKSVDNKS